MSQQTLPLTPDPSPQLRVVLDYFKHLSFWELDKLSLLSSDNFIQETLPASMGIRSRTKSEDITFLKGFRDSLFSFPLEILIYDINESKGKVWIHMLMNPVNVECFFLFEFGTGNEEELIVRVIEFVDSKKFTEMNAQSSQIVKSPIQALTSSVYNLFAATGHCYLDMMLFVPRTVIYVLGVEGNLKSMARASGAVARGM